MLLVTFLVTLAVGDAPDCGLLLRVEPPIARVRPGDCCPPFSATISNRGQRVLTLVLPGDGSNGGDRTPIVRWEYGPAVVRSSKVCGNYRPLQPGEVFTLHPGTCQAL